MPTKKPLKIGDNGTSEEFAIGDTLPVANLDLASQGDAEAGTDNTKLMTPLRTAQAITAQVGDVVITPPEITADESDYNPTGFDTCSVVRVSCNDTIPAILGFNYNGRSIKFRNVGANPLMFRSRHPDTSSSFLNLGEGDYALLPGREVTWHYDSVASAWYPDNIPNISDSAYVFYQKALFGSTTAADYSELAWGVLAVGTVVAKNADANSPSGFTIRTHVNTTLSGGIIYLTKTVNHFWFFGAAELEAWAMIRIPVLSAATNRFTCGLQIRATVNGGTVYVNNTLSLDYDHDVVGGNWQLFSQSNSGVTESIDTGIPVEANKNYYLKIVINKARTEARFFINGEVEGVIQVNLPSSAAIGARCFLLRNGAGTIVRELHVMQLGAKSLYTLA